MEIIYFTLTAIVLYMISDWALRRMEAYAPPTAARMAAPARRSFPRVLRRRWYAGGVIRSLHRYASDALVIVMMLFLVREYVMDRLHGPRWFTWAIGAPILWLVFAAGISGYWLVWDKFAHYVALATSELLDALPLFGEPIARNFIHDSTLSGRFFTLMPFIHIAVPLLLLFIGGGGASLRRHAGTVVHRLHDYEAPCGPRISHRLPRQRLLRAPANALGRGAHRRAVRSASARAGAAGTDRQLLIDGEPLFIGSLPPSGLAGDGTSTAYVRFVVTTGQHLITARLRDSRRREGFDYEHEQTVELVAEQNLVVDFRADTGGFRFL